jgi:hypothetical protein
MRLSYIRMDPLMPEPLPARIGGFEDAADTVSGSRVD